MAKRAVIPAAIDPQIAVRARFVEHGTDPAIAKKALEDATSLSRGLWLSFLTFGTYLVITFAGVDHRDLLLETPITLPVLNAPLPLVTFFWVAPILYVIFHLYLLLSLKLLADQVHNYVGQMEEVGLDSDAQDRARLQLPNFVVVQVLGGTSAQVSSWAGRLLGFTAFLTLVAGPLILLLFAQLMFLPYHGWGVTMAQRVLVMVDLVFIWYFWRAITRREGFHFWGGAASAGLVVLTFFGFMYPGERFYGALPKLVFVETGLEFEDTGFFEKRAVGLDVFYNTLSLPSARLVDDDLIVKLETRNRAKGLQPWEGERSLGDVLNNRDFRFANFNNIDLRKADLSKSYLDGANLDYAVLDGVLLDGVSLQGASLSFASLKAASLKQAFLQNATLTQVSLEAALMNEASLQGASLAAANLNGASLEGAWMQGVLLDGASLDGANLRSANLHGANLVQASLIGASLAMASLDGANLTEAWLSAASFNEASLNGATIDTSLLRATSLRRAQVWRSTGRFDFSVASIEEISFAPLTPGAYKELFSRALQGVPENDIHDVSEAVKSLNPEFPESEGTINWPQLVNNDEQSQWITADLSDIACSEQGRPYVAQSIVDARFDEGIGDLGAENLPLIQTLIAGCPGTVGMNQKTIDRLRKLEAEFELTSP